MTATRWTRGGQDLYEKVLQSVTLLTKLLWVRVCPRANFFVAEVELSLVKSKVNMTYCKLSSTAQIFWKVDLSFGVCGLVRSEKAVTWLTKCMWIRICQRAIRFLSAEV